MRFSILCGSRHMAEWHILPEVFWILKFFVWFWLCSCSLYLVLSIVNWVCFWAMFNNDTVSVDANWVTFMLATTGSKEINLESELFSLIPCWLACTSFCGWHVSYVVVIIIDVSWSGSISAHKNCTPYHSPVFCFCLLSLMMCNERPHGHNKAADVQISSLFWSSCVAIFKLTLWNQN
jgi:hypothetical protein